MKELFVMLVFTSGPQSYVVFDRVKHDPDRADAKYTAKCLIDWNQRGHSGKPGFKRQVVILDDDPGMELGVAYVPVRDFFGSPTIAPEDVTCQK